MKIVDRAALAIVSCGGLGYVPFASGTFGAAAGTFIAWSASAAAAEQWFLLITTTILALACIPSAQRQLKDNDPSIVVIDEFCGALLVFAGLPFLTLLQWTIGFIAFRLLDIIKPPPIRQLEKIPGAWGVLLDDLAAGLIARLLVIAIGIVL